LELCWWNFGDYPVDELSPNPWFDQPSQHHKNSLTTEEKAKFHQFNSEIYNQPLLKTRKSSNVKSISLPINLCCAKPISFTKVV